MQPFSCQHRDQHISKRNYEISVVQEIHISRLELQRGSLEFVISFSKVYIWDRGLATSFWDHVIKSLIRQMNFQYIFSQLWKVKIFCGNIHSLKSKTYFRGRQKPFVVAFIPYYQILIFEEQLCMSNRGLQFDTF